MSSELLAERRSLEMLKLSNVKKLELKLRCPGCGNVPLCSVGLISPFTIKMGCHICKTEWMKSYSEILHSNEKSENKPREVGLCIYHQNQKCEFYCEDCKKSYCRRCKEEDEDHKKCTHIIILNDLPKKSEFTKKIKEAKEYIEFNSNNLKDICIKRLQEKISKIESIFNAHKIINSLILDFVELLNDNYNSDDYNSISNLITNTKFNLEKITEHQTIQDIVKKVEVNFLLTPKESKFPYPSPKLKSRLEKQFTFHSEEVRAVCLLNDNRIASASKDKTIKIINPQKNRCDIVIEEHLSAVFSLITLKNGNLVSSSADKTIKVFEIQKNSYTCITTMLSHSNGICKMININEKYFVSASADKTIKIWVSKFPFVPVKTLRGHTGCIFSVIKLRNSNTLVSGSAPNSKGGDSTIRFWNFESEIPEKTINEVDCCNNNSLAEASNNIILSGSAYMDLYLIDSIKRRVLRVVKCSYLVDSLLIIDERIFIGNNFGGILYFSTKEESPICITKMHDNVVNDIIVIDNDRICSCSKDKSVRIWSLSKM